MAQTYLADIVKQLVPLEPKPGGQRYKILNLLRGAGRHGVSTNDFLSRHGIGSRFGGRIGELRKAGFKIETIPYRAGGGAIYKMGD